MVGVKSGVKWFFGTPQGIIGDSRATVRDGQDGPVAGDGGGQGNLLVGSRGAQGVECEGDCSATQFANVSENRPLERVISNSFGFGGTNCSLIFGWLN